MGVTDTNNVEERKILVLYVGGTIGMMKNELGVYVPASNAFVKHIKKDQQMHDAELAKRMFKDLKYNECVLPIYEKVLIKYEIKEYDPLLDSSHMTTKHWISIAKDIEKFYNDYDGFVILHGTDTLTYTSSALSFMLSGLNKSVILTGAQIPIFEPRSDGKDNFTMSLIFAGCYNIPEVCLFFAHTLYRGNRTTKVSANLLDAFKSINYHALASASINIQVHQHYITPSNQKVKFTVETNLNKDVALLNIFPTITADMIEALTRPPVKGLVLLTYGTGNMPSKNGIIEKLSEAVERGVVIVNITQCPHGSVTSCYEPAKNLEDIGILCGQDMTPEAALTKLCFVLGQQGLTYSQKVEMMKTNLRGELTAPVTENATNGFKFVRNNVSNCGS